MRTFVQLLMALALVGPALAQRDIGTVEVTADTKTVPVRVSSASPELNDLAIRAFSTHGRYRLVASGFAYDIRFTSAGPTQVRVDVLKGTSSFASETLSGSSAREALLRAADAAVEKTNGLGLRGYFASKLTFIGEMTGHKEVYTGDLLFGGVRRITSDGKIALMPRWSPDGRRVIYTSFVHGAPDIFVIDLGSNQRTTFASFRGTNSGARFSADGRSVAMILTGSGAPEVWVSDGQGRGLSRRTHSESAKSSPCWSPDGSRIVFAGEPGPQLYVIPASGGSAQRLTFATTSGSSGYCAEPDWSRADPSKIAFTVREGSRFQIAVYDFGKHAYSIVSKAPFDGVEPSWLPDGRHLVYTARNASTNRLCILDTETGKSTPVSPASFGSALQGNVWAP